MNDIRLLLQKQKQFWDAGTTRPIAFRLNALRTLQAEIVNREAQIMDALKQDLGKAAFESYATEIGFALEEIRSTIRRLPRWAKAQRVSTPLMHFPSSSKILYEPYGNVLIMSPWNYPFQLAIAPLVGAIAAGNTCIVKPSAYAANTATVVRELLAACFDAEYVSTVLGGRQQNQELLNQRFDYIFFTGSVAVGKLVMESAAAHLTPVTLELGGKSPCLVDSTADISVAARRIVWGKFLNAGQTCVAPDYVLAHRGIKQQLIRCMGETVEQFYGKNPIANDAYPKIVNRKHYDRLVELIDADKIIYGGQASAERLKIEPTVLVDVNWDSRIMQDEIFGPILPILEFTDVDDAIDQINKRAKPLACYMFSRNKAQIDQVLSRVPFGGGCVNDTIVHLANSNLPFGGVGQSGMGSYHGQHSFNTFSHKKSVLKKANWLDLPVRYPPFKNKLKLLKKLMK